jgi:TetR/AcrR family transcriptional regulator, mexCD-oprJ operon repressor
MTTAKAGDDTARPMRADARRNIAAILQAATACLCHDPDASVAEIAAAAGVGRITLYGHFKTRGELVEAVLVRTVEQAHSILEATDTTGDPREALTRLTAASWQVVHQFQNLVVAAQRELPAERVLSVHDQIMRRIQELIERGQRSGVFRTDLPEQWLVTIAVNLMHLAATECAAGRVAAEDVPRLLSATLLASFTPPGTVVALPE